MVVRLRPVRPAQHVALLVRHHWNERNRLLLDRERLDSFRKFFINSLADTHDLLLALRFTYSFVTTGMEWNGVLFMYRQTRHDWLGHTIPRYIWSEERRFTYSFVRLKWADRIVYSNSSECRHYRYNSSPSTFHVLLGYRSTCSLFVSAQSGKKIFANFESIAPTINLISPFKGIINCCSTNSPTPS